METIKPYLSSVFHAFVPLHVFYRAEVVTCLAGPFGLKQQPHFLVKLTYCSLHLAETWHCEPPPTELSAGQQDSEIHN